MCYKSNNHADFKLMFYYINKKSLAIFLVLVLICFLLYFSTVQKKHNNKGYRYQYIIICYYL